MTIKKALTFRASSIGDCLMGKYLLDNIHSQFPNARLGIVVASRGEMIRDLLAQYKWIEVIEVNRYSPAALLQLWWKWRGSDFVVTQYAGKPGGAFSFTSKIFARLIAKKHGLVGFTDAFRWNSFLYDALVPFCPDVAPAELERRAIEKMGVAISVPYPTIVHKPQSEALSRFSLTSGGYVLVHLFSGSKKRGLSPERKRSLAASLVQTLPQNIEIVLTGTASEKEEALMVAQGTRAKVIAQKTTLQEMMSLISQSRGVVAVDTGVAHIAAQMHKSVVVLSTCLGAHWWVEGQYGPDTSAGVITNKAACGGEHDLVDYPPCINRTNLVISIGGDGLTFK